MLHTSLLPLSSASVKLRALSERDADRYAAGSADPLVREFGHLPEPEYTPESVQTMIREQVEPALREGSLAVLAITDNADEFSGSLVLFNVTPESAEIGFWVHPDRRGTGVTAEAIELAASLARGSGMRHLLASTLPENAGSQRVLLRAGFSETGRALDTTPAGETVETLQFAREL